MDSEPPPSLPPATTTTTTMSASLSLLVEATGDSESDYPAADRGGWPVVDADEGDAESCCGGDEDGGGGGGRAADSVEVLQWERWVPECVSYQQLQDGNCAASALEDAAAAAAAAGDAESDRLFWEACIAHGF